jgi:hypothetical protein
MNDEAEDWVRLALPVDKTSSSSHRKSIVWALRLSTFPISARFVGQIEILRLHKQRRTGRGIKETA